MTGIKQSWVIFGSLLFVMVTGLTALAEDSPFSNPNESFPDPSASTIPPAPRLAGQPTSQSSDSETSGHRIPTYYPQPHPCPPGCYARFMSRCRAKYWGYPEEFFEPPLGAAAQGQEIAMIENGRAARMGLYQYDFFPDSAQLNARGKGQLCRIAMWLPTNCYPVFVEPTPARPELDELRRQAIWNDLSTNFVLIPAERVVIGRPNIRDLGSADSLLIDRNRLGLTASRGITAGGGGTSGTSTTASSSGAGISGR